MTHHDKTLIEQLAGVIEGSPIDRAFRARDEARRNAEVSYQLLLHPKNPDPVSLIERRAVALFVAALHEEPQTLGYFTTLLRETEGVEEGLVSLVQRDAEQSARPGPYGRFPEGPLSVEDLDGPAYEASGPLRNAAGVRLTAALEHAHLLVLHPRDASPVQLEALVLAGWSTAGIVVLSQLVAFLSFQIRVVAGLRTAVLTRQPHAELVG
ncbi:CMD domain protein [Pseudotabrizicola sp. 4114]|uniref:CMD domain protein n=1 Tax=Pseudotabrizicola sp. 4114 TaxID=2817731 RepID=UPI0028559E32|nr:CMD domain protein [Pseudorhodobacter sp. 4114]